jgi:hypothetical protein
MIDFDYFYREELTLNEPWARRWDVFLSVFDGTDRVRQVFQHVNATTKIWLYQPEYHIPNGELPAEDGLSVSCSSLSDLQAVIARIQALVDVRRARLCIDITGMIRPTIAALTNLLKRAGVLVFDALYSVPTSYGQRDQTRFSSGIVSGVGEVPGFEGVNTPSAREVLILAPGFDSVLVQEVLRRREHATRVHIFGLPSLQADMYQHNVLRAFRLDQPPPEETANARRFVAAADPFRMAAELSDIVAQFRRDSRPVRFYIAPLATKAQMLGAALFHIVEGRFVGASIIYPTVSDHHSGTSTGLAKVSINTIDFELCDALSARAQAVWS